MIDAGAIIKMGQARIGVGSSTVSVDRSGGALQVLGTPDSRVIITSINDTTGIGTNLTEPLQLRLLGIGVGSISETRLMDRMKREPIVSETVCF